MSQSKSILFSALITVLLLSSTAVAPSQVGIGINLGPAPICPYGYFDYAPYACAPYGYYGPDWFVGGLFIGAGPWFHGPRGFYGHVDNRYDPRHGYMDRCRSAARSSSTTSRVTRRATGRAT
jgi:hypothetical protein